MIINYKDTVKMAGICVVSFCAVFICTLFLNYNLDLATIKSEITGQAPLAFYEALEMTGKVTASVSGGCLLLTTIILLCFYIGLYINMHKKELGILKALGYARFTLARGFWVFGLPVFTGCGLGYFCAHLLMPTFYDMQNDSGMLPDFSIGFHPALCFLLVGAPSIFFALLAVCYSYFKLNAPALELLQEKIQSGIKTARADSDLPFLKEYRRSNLRQRKSLIFFIAFAAFCFSAMTQMAASMDELASRMMAVMMVGIGFTLACVTLFIAATSILHANSKAILLMKAFGYRDRELADAALNGYRPWAYLGFALGTIYQYGLLKMVVSIVFKDIAGIPDYRFDVQAMLAAFLLFAAMYEGVMQLYVKRMRRGSLKEIMME